jgi:hypothetical protein
MSIAAEIWQAGSEIAAWLDRGMLFTDIARDLSGEEIVSEITSREGRSVLRPGEHRHLETWRDDIPAGYRRDGMLRTSSGAPVARITSVFLPERIPDRFAVETLQSTNMPLGRALFALGVHRETLTAQTLDSGPYVLHAAGRLLIPAHGGLVPVALAEERVFRDFAVRG